MKKILIIPVLFFFGCTKSVIQKNETLLDIMEGNVCACGGDGFVYGEGTRFLQSFKVGDTICLSGEPVIILSIKPRGDGATLTSWEDSWTISDTK